MTSPRLSIALAALVSLLGAARPAAADGFDEAGARSKMEAAGYAGVTEVHEGNLGEWMAKGMRNGQQVLLVLYPNGTVALRQQESVPPAKSIEELAPPAKP